MVNLEQKQLLAWEMIMVSPLLQSTTASADVHALVGTLLDCSSPEQASAAEQAPPACLLACCVVLQSLSAHAAKEELVVYPVVRYDKLPT